MFTGLGGLSTSGVRWALTSDNLEGGGGGGGGQTTDIKHQCQMFEEKRFHSCFNCRREQG